MSPHPFGRIPCLLVIDPQDDTRLMLRTLFALEGYDVIVADSARSAYAAVARRAPDVILLDGRLPDDDALSLAERIGQRDGKTSRRVVFLSSYAAPGLEDRARAAGCDSFHLKPLDFDRLLETVRRMTGQR